MVRLIALQNRLELHLETLGVATISELTGEELSELERFRPTSWGAAEAD